MENPKHEVVFTIADIRHVEQMYEIEKEVFSSPWSYESMTEDVCVHDIAIYIVGTYEDKVVSYVGMWCVREEAHIMNIAVKKEFRKKGIGKLMMRKMLYTASQKKVKTLTLEVRKSNTAAIRLYESVGFVKGGLRKKYYTDTKEDAIIMNKIL